MRSCSPKIGWRPQLNNKTSSLAQAWELSLKQPMLVSLRPPSSASYLQRAFGETHTAPYQSDCTPESYSPHSARAQDEPLTLSDSRNKEFPSQRLSPQVSSSLRIFHTARLH